MVYWSHPPNRDFPKFPLNWLARSCCKGELASEGLQERRLFKVFRNLFISIAKSTRNIVGILTSSSTKTKRSLMVTDDDHAPPSFENGRKPLTILLANACEPAAPLFKFRESNISFCSRRMMESKHEITRMTRIALPVQAGTIITVSVKRVISSSQVKQVGELILHLSVLHFNLH